MNIRELHVTITDANKIAIISEDWTDLSDDEVKKLIQTLIELRVVIANNAKTIRSKQLDGKRQLLQVLKKEIEDIENDIDTGGKMPKTLKVSW